MVPDIEWGNTTSLEKLHLADLDKIATPSPLRLRIGRDLYDNNPAGQARIYPLVGSFVQFLIETYGVDKYRGMFSQTPLVPFEREPGSPDRWRKAYGLSLADLAARWMALIVSCTSSPGDFGGDVRVEEEGRPLDRDRL
jgi:hypothetical protein